MMLTRLLAIAAGLGAIQAQDCYKYSGCTECVVQPHCGWCPTAASCWSGSASGPSNPQQHCNADDWSFDECKSLRLQDGQRVSVKEPKGGFYEYYDFGLLYQGRDVTVIVDNGAVVSNRRLFASQTVSLPRTNQHEWEGTVKGSLLELRLGKADNLDYGKPLFLSVLNEVSTSYSIIAEMVPPSSGGELKSCSFTVVNTTFSMAYGLRAASAIAEICSKTSQSGDAFMQRLINEPSPLTEWEVVGAVTFEVYKALLKYSSNLHAEGYQTLILSASSPYPYQGPKVVTLWRSRAQSVAKPALVSAQLAKPVFKASCSSNPGWVVEGHSSSLSETVQSWIVTVFNQYLCGNKETPDSWDWASTREIGIVDDFWVEWIPFQTIRGWRWEVNGAVALDNPDVHWVWARQGATTGEYGPYLYVALKSVPVVPESLSIA
eukprot:m.217295 g.217295  ORF g.217295 m.217295 type:complete len:433 (+) comp15556_c0_seq4:3278-4576(+)